VTGSERRAGITDPRLLLLLPAAVYLTSYAYLALDHGRAWLWSTPVHESGRYSLLETTFYASHFLGHVPVLLTVVLLAAGSWRSMSPPSLSPVRRGRALAVAGLGLLVSGSLALAIGHFGLDDTLAFILQRRQRPDDIVAGGSWNLHLPSTLLQFALIPVAVFLARLAFARPVVWSRRGLVLLAGAAAVAVGMTCLVNRDPVAAVAGVWRDPRYLAHSVRELVTFPLTYYPLALAVLLSGEAPLRRERPAVSAPNLLIGALAALFAAGFLFQVTVSLGHDIGALAQQPSFAEGGRLAIPYLLASHFFEHFLDSVFFTLVTLLLVWGCRSVPSGADPASPMASGFASGYAVTSRRDRSGSGSVLRTTP
jgi:hypothetical protein